MVDRGGHGASAELHISVDEDEHVPAGLLREPMARPGLAEPSGGREIVGSVDDFDPRIRSHDLADHVTGAIGRAVVEDEDLQVGQAFLCQQ